MKTTKNLAMGLGLIAAVAAVSCSDYDAIDEAAIKHEAAVKEYSQNFVSYFGQPDPNHTWGFGKAATRGNAADKNIWGEANDDIPGWPFPSNYTWVVGYQYTNGNGDYNNVSETKPAFDGEKVPAGDVTDEEIAYVSWWFRTHKNPTKGKLPSDNFYIQGISADNDRVADPKKSTTGLAVKTADIYELNENGDYVKTGTTGIEKFTIDKLMLKDKDTADDHVFDFNASNANNLSECYDLWIGDHVDGIDDHFITNYGTGSGYVSLASKTPCRMMDYYWSMDTEDVSAHYSNDAQYRDCWALVELDFTVNDHRYHGWYLGFDYGYYKAETTKTYYINPETGEEQDWSPGTWLDNGVWDAKLGTNVYTRPDGTKTTEQFMPEYEVSRTVVTKYSEIKPDGYYSNWILKVTPSTSGNPTVKKVFRRIMCEDLGNTFDFDFNDVVFDAEWTENNPNQIDITVQAAGGTMRIDVAGTDIKAQWGVEYSQPVNVGMGVTKDPFTFTINVSNVTTKDEALAAMKNIAITAHGEDGIYNISGNNYQDKENADNNTNSAPFVFAVPAKIRWTKEYQPIDEAYKNFKKWVENEAGNSTWYATDTDNSKLY